MYYYDAKVVLSENNKRLEPNKFVTAMFIIAECIAFIFGCTFPMFLFNLENETLISIFGFIGAIIGVSVVAIFHNKYKKKWMKEHSIPARICIQKVDINKYIMAIEFASTNVAAISLNDLMLNAKSAKFYEASEELIIINKDVSIFTGNNYKNRSISIYAGQDLYAKLRSLGFHITFIEIPDDDVDID